MPDVTVTFTDAQWARVIAATSNIKRLGESGNVDAAYLAAKWLNQVERWVKDYEKAQGAVSSW